ncbi:hypothetical protein ABPG72_009451 [Tetrahymena utriculariae]
MTKQKRAERLYLFLQFLTLILRTKGDCNDPNFIQKTGFQNYGCLIQTGTTYTAQQVIDYGFDQNFRDSTSCNPNFLSIGHRQGPGKNKIQLSLSAQQQIKDISITYDFFYADAPNKLNYNQVVLSDGTKTVTQSLQITTYQPLTECTYSKFNYGFQFNGVNDLQFQSFYFDFVCSTNELISVQSVSNVLVYVNYYCPLNCSSCDSNQNCQTCLTTSYYVAKNPTNNLNYCKLKCASYQYATLPDQYTQSQTCKNCVQDCLACSSDQDCSVCKNGNEFVSLALKCLPTCNSNQYRDSNFQCQNCMANCLQCTGPQNCNTCLSPFTFNSSTFQCICPIIGYFLDSNGNCNQCDPSCKSCSGALNSNCTSCLTNWFSLGSYCYQWCPNNYQKQLSNFQCVQCKQYNIPDCQTCNLTCRSCLFNQKNTCLDCYGTRQINNGKCTCKNISDARDIYFECSYSNIAVLQATLDSKSPLLKVDFGVNLQPIPNLKCNQIFNNPTLSDIGKTATCIITSTSIVVQLSDDSIIKENDEIFLVPGILSYQVSASTFIDTFYLLNIVQLRDLNPYLDFQYDQVQNTCSDIQFSLTAKNDAQRGFLSFSWSIEVQPLLQQSIQSKVDSIIQKANTQRSTSLIIDKYLIPPDSQITVQFSYILKVNWQDTQKFTTLYQKLKRIVISTIQSQYDPIYRYYSLSIYYSFYIQTCDQSGPSIFTEPLNISIQSQVMPQLNQNYASFQSSQIQIDIQPYSIPIGSQLDLNVQATLVSNQTITEQNNLQIQPQLTNLFIQIQGGSTQLINYKESYILQGIARDYEVKDETAPQGINLVWSCLSIVQNNGDNQCYNYLKQVFNIQQTGLSITIPGKTFQPYQTLNFTFQGTKDSRKSQSSVLISLSEVDLPPLTLQFQNPPQLETVNLNEDILLQFIYSSNISSDVLTYAGAILYNDEVEGVIKFDFYQVKVRIWDYFSNVLPSNKVIQLRFTVYNPAYLMPSMSVINFNVNLPPSNCVLQVTPQNGDALITNFYIKMVGCSSSNVPITYQFFYYLSQDELNSEIQNPQIITRRQILDQTTISEKNTFLPEGKIIVMAQSMDSKFAIFNSTLQVQVSPLNCDEQTLLNMIDSVLSINNNQQLASQIVLSLSVIGEQISKRNPLFNLSSVIQRKLLILDQLINQTNQLPKSSFLYTYSNKVMAQLQSSLPTQSDTQISSLLDQVNKQLSKQFSTSNQLAKDNNIQLQNLVDSFKIINATTQTLSYDLLPTQINISSSICNQLNTQTLPNQGGIQLLGNMINLDCQLVTDKNLQQYMQVYSSAPSDQTNIYNAANLIFAQNPYKETIEFKNYTSQLQQADPTLKISYNQVIYPNITNKNINANYHLDSQIVLKFPNATVSKNNSNMSCIQQQEKTWSSKGCQILQNKKINGYYCYCDKQNPTTIIDDLSQLLNNKNLQTAFSSQGFENLSNFSDFYKFAIFWFLSSLTVVQIGLYFYGSFLDKKYQGGIKFYKALSKVSPLEEKNEQDELFRRQSDNCFTQQETPQQQQQQQQTFESHQIAQQSKQRNFVNGMKQNDINRQIYGKKFAQFSELQLQKSQQNQIENEKEQSPDLKMLYNSQNLKENISTKHQEDPTDRQQDLKILKSLFHERQQKSKNDLTDKKNKTNQNFESNKTINKNALKFTSSLSNEEIFQLDENIQQESLKDEQNSSKDQNNKEKSSKKSEENKKKQKKKKEQEDNQNVEKYMSYPIMIRILVFHDFFSIFFLFDEVISRSIRFTIFYIRMIHCLSISTIFSQQYNEVQMIMVSLLNSIVLQVSLTIIKLTHKIKIIGKQISTVVMIALCLFYYYIILSIVSGQSAPSSNSKIVSFFITVAVDFVFVSTLISICKMLIVSKMMNKQNPIKIIVRLYNLLNLLEAIQNLSI